MAERRLVERALVSAPAIVHPLLAVIERLPRSSSLGRRFVFWRTQRGMAALNRRDWKLVRMLVHPDVEVEISGTATLGPGFEPSAHGRDAFIAFWQRVFEPFAEAYFVIERMHVAPGGRVVILCRFVTRGAASGVVVEQRASGILSLERGLLQHAEMFWDWEPCLEAAGLASAPPKGWN